MCHEWIIPCIRDENNIIIKRDAFLRLFEIIKLTGVPSYICGISQSLILNLYMLFDRLFNITHYFRFNINKIKLKCKHKQCTLYYH